MNLTQIVTESWNRGVSYDTYAAYTEQLVADGKTSLPEADNEALVKYTRLNWKRLLRVGKTVAVLESLLDLLQLQKHSQRWLVITEPWCGDAAQSVPVLNLLADNTPMIDLRVVQRDQHLPLMDSFLTNGGRSIPKLIILNNKFEVLADWGPRPQPVQQMVMDYKDRPEPKPPYSVFIEQVQQWYNKDRSMTIQHEILEILQQLDRS